MLFNEPANIDDYVITKESTDLLSSLQRMKKTILSESMELYDVESIEEIAHFSLYTFEALLSECITDINTQQYFSKLIKGEDKFDLSFIYFDDVTSFYIFLYKKEGKYSYYIPIEIKKIIMRLLGKNLIYYMK